MRKFLFGVRRLLSRVRYYVPLVAGGALLGLTSTASAQDPPVIPTDGIPAIETWVQVVANKWFGLVGLIIGFIFAAVILWKGVGMVSRRLTRTR